MSADETDIDDQPAAEETRNWPELVTEVYDRISEDSDGGLSVRFQDMEIQVPSRTGAGADKAHWNLDGTVDLNPDEETG